SYYRDPELDLYLAGIRYYDPQAARWASKDPIGFDAGDANLYRYVGNNPVNEVDPSGLDEESAFRILAKMVREKYESATSKVPRPVREPIEAPARLAGEALRRFREEVLDQETNLPLAPIEAGWPSIIIAPVSEKSGVRRATVGDLLNAEAKQRQETGNTIAADLAAGGLIGGAIKAGIRVTRGIGRAVSGAARAASQGATTGGRLTTAGRQGAKVDDGVAKVVQQELPGESVAPRKTGRGSQKAFADEAEQIVSDATGIPRNPQGAGQQTIPGTGRGGVRIPDLKVRGAQGSVRLRGSVVEVKASRGTTFGDLSSRSRDQIRDAVDYVQRLRSKASLVKDPEFKDLLRRARVEVFSDLPAPKSGEFADLLRDGLLEWKLIPR
ncbi:MAG: RHS repeat-associated core domain-containing protein, partial [Candidatus Paceibacterota bacterium]